MSSRHHTAVALLLILFALAVPASSMAEDRLGGHFGVVFPLVTRVGGETTTISDQFKLGFPMGITVKTADTWAFDLELVPVVTSDRFVSLTVHPGVVHSLAHLLGAGEPADRRVRDERVVTPSAGTRRRDELERASRTRRARCSPS